MFIPTRILKLAAAASAGTAMSARPFNPGLQAEYDAAFPKGEDPNAQRGQYFGQRLTSAQMDVRNRHQLNKQMMSGAVPATEANQALLRNSSGSPNAAYVGSLGQSAVELGQMGNPMYWGSKALNAAGYTGAANAVQAMNPLHRIGEGIESTTGAKISDPMASDSYVKGYLGDSGRRIANRYGADFELQHENDKMLDWSSYLLEAAPSIMTLGSGAAGVAGVKGVGAAANLARAAGTPGRLLGAGVKSVGGLATKIPGAGRIASIGKSLSPVVTGAKLPGQWGANVAAWGAKAPAAGAGFFGKTVAPYVRSTLAGAIPKTVDYATMAINPLPALYSAVFKPGITNIALPGAKAFMQAPGQALGRYGQALASTIGLGFKQWAGQVAANTAVNSYGNASNEVDAMTADNPNASFVDKAKEYGMSLASTLAVDPTKAFTGNYVPGLGMPAAVAAGVISQNERAADEKYLQQMQTEQPQLYNALMSDPSGLALQKNLDENKAKSQEAYAAAPKPQVDGFWNNAGQYASQTAGGAFQALAKASPFLNLQSPIRGYTERTEQARQDNVKSQELALTPYYTAMGEGRDPMQDPAVTKNMSPEALKGLNDYAFDTLANRGMTRVLDTTPPESLAAIQQGDLSAVAGTWLEDIGNDEATAEGKQDKIVYSAAVAGALQQASSLIASQRSAGSAPEQQALAKSMQALMRAKTPAARFAALQSAEPALVEFFNRQPREGDPAEQANVAPPPVNIAAAQPAPAYQAPVSSRNHPAM